MFLGKLFGSLYVQSQASNTAHVSLYLRVLQAAGQVKFLIFLVKIKFFPYMPIVFVMQVKCLFKDILRPESVFFLHQLSILLKSELD